MPCQSALLSTTTNIAILILVAVKSSPAIPFEAFQQADYGAWSGVEFSANDSAYTPPADWIGKNKSSIRTGQNDSEASGDFFDYPDLKPPGGLGPAGDMLYMLPLFTLIDRLNEADIKVPIISWPLKTGQKNTGVSGDGQASAIGIQPESDGAVILPPAELSKRSEDEKPPLEDNDGHIHIGQGKKCLAPGCNNGLCRCPECDAIAVQTTGQKRLLETAPEATSAKKEKLSPAGELSAEAVENTGQVHEQSRTRPNNPAAASTNIVHALTRREATGAPLSRLMDQALYSQYLLQAVAPIQPLAVLNDEAEEAEFVVLCSTRFITWGYEPYFRVWSEQESSWSAIVVPMAISRFQVIVPVACNRFFTWTEDGSIRLWTEMQGEWSDLEITTQAGIPGTLLVLSDGQLVASSNRRLVVWTEVSGI